MTDVVNSADMEPPIVYPVSQIQEEPDLCVRAGDWVDGLPLILQIRRSVDIQTDVLRRFGCRAEQLPPPIAAAMGQLQDACNMHLKHQGVADEQYTSYIEVGALFGDSLTVRAFGEHSPLSIDDDAANTAYHGHGGLARNTSMCMDYGNDLDISDCEADIASVIGGSTHLQLSLTDSSLGLQRKDDRKQPVGKRRAFVSEKFSLLPSAVATVAGRESQPQISSEQYNQMARELMALAPNERSQAVSSLKFEVPRADLAEALCAIGHALHTAYHKRDLVHSDIKPSNILLADSVQLIDGVGVPVGKPSVVASPGWGAPEQVLNQPVSAATDVYPLGQMLLRLTEASVYGEEKTFVIPFKEGRKRVRLMGSLGVTVKAGKECPVTTGRAEWQAFIAECLSFDASARPSDGATFASQLEKLMRTHPLQGSIQLQRNDKVRLGTAVIGGLLQPTWIVMDHHRAHSGQFIARVPCRE